MSGVPVLATSESAQDVSPRIGIEKRCSKCKKIKLLTEFSPCGKYYRPACKTCTNMMPVDKVKRNEATQRWRKRNPDKVQASGRAWRDAHKEERQARLNMWRKNNPDRVRVLNKRGWKERMSKPAFRLAASVKVRIWMALRDSKAGQSWQRLVGFTLEDLKRHLEALFQPGMTWENYGQWHVDHIRPVCSFNFNSPDDEDFKMCWSLDNLQPLWARDNQSKGGRWENH